METDYYDDDDSYLTGSTIRDNIKGTFDFGDDEDEEAFLKKELVLENTLEEKKSKKQTITSGEVEDDYWEKITKRHAKTNVKGAAGWHERVFSGNPERERELFNHDMNSTITSGVADLNSVVGSVETNFDYGTVSAGESTSGEGSVGVGEALDKNYKALFESLLALAGFKIIPDNDNAYKVIDLCDNRNKFKCKDTDEILNVLNPYLLDCVIYPLQDATGENFETYKEWCDWYKEDICKQYPEQKINIDYCDLLNNHIKEITF